MKTRHFGIALAGLIAASAGAQQPPPPAEPPIDRSIAPYASLKDSVKLPDGRSLHFVCMGEGAPTVILTAGLGGDAIDWRMVQPQIAETTRVCAWDRPGFALSDGSAQDQSVLTTTADLEAALAAGPIPGPYVMVGHSLGSYESLLYADRHPDKVVGMVLVDGSFPNQRAVLEKVASISAEQQAGQNASLAFLRKCAAGLQSGAIRPGGPDPERCFDYPHHYPPEFRAALDAKIANPIQYRTLASFLENADNAGTLVVNPDRNYGPMPLIVLTGIQPNEFPGITDEQRTQQAAMAIEWNLGHDAMAALSTRGVNTRVPGAGHYVQQDKPQVVIDAVETVVAEARAAAR